MPELKIPNSVEYIDVVSTSNYCLAAPIGRFTYIILYKILLHSTDYLHFAVGIRK